MSLCCVALGNPDRKGYHRVFANNTSKLAHRVAWEEASGSPVPDGFCVLHVCDNPACIRADDHGVYAVGAVEYERRGHLWLGTHAANMRDCALKGRARGGQPTPSQRPRGDAHYLRRDPVKAHAFAARLRQQKIDKRLANPR